MSRFGRTFFGPALAALLVAPLAAQDAPPRMVEGVLATADTLYFANEPMQSYELLRTHLETSPNDYEALWRASRAAVVIGIIRDGIAYQNEYLDPAIVLGDRAVAERPQGVDALYWRGAAEGRRALNAGNDYASRLVQRVYDDAHAILAVDSLHAGAHNLLGRVNYEVMDLSRVERMLARMLVSNQAIRSSSWDQAALHLRRAAELEPYSVLFWLDLGQLYMRRGRNEDARITLLRVTEMESIHPPDDKFKGIARRWLAELD
jgi:tetratricopeptide (TPR) repeat protein